MPRLPATNRDKVKTERVSVVTTPIIKGRIEKIAFMQRKTINELINDILKAYIKKHGADLQKYKETFESEDQETQEEAPATEN